MLFRSQTGGTATSGADYSAFGTQAVTFSGGANSGATQNTTLTVTNGTLLEGPETVVLTLGNLGAGGTGTTLGNTTNTTTISDNESATLAIGATSGVTEQGGAQSVGVVTLTITGTGSGTFALGNGIALTADVTLTKPVAIKRPITLDCAGHTLKATSTGAGRTPSVPDLAFVVHDTRNVTVKNCVLDGFDYQEDTAGRDHSKYLWANSAYALGARITDAFAKYNIREQTWDYGEMDRTCGIDQSIIGLPIAASSAGIIYEHEVSPDADGQPLNASLLTGWYAMSEGEDVMFLDWALPDMIWRTFDSSNSSASIKITFYSTYYPGNTPQTHGPYTVTQSTQYINPRIRGRLIQIKVESNDIGSFWRLGAVRMRLAKDGRL
mgnify:CR=1 FL=1